ncbi:MAG: ABC transporter permease [Lachnospiraceae bacterium]
MLKKIFSLPIEVFQNRKLILTLAKNDFKTKYAGSYLGIIWAFVQPVITILVYWFVFGMLRSTDRSDVPFVLWLIAGLVPWFFFQEGLSGGTNALIEYQYLVKKVVFKISILPMVKVLSASFVHIFFVAFMLVVYALQGYFPNLHFIQVIYYSFCTYMLVLALSYLTSAVVVFFRDLTQIINIVLQIGVWVTPIMWDFADVGQSSTGTLATILKFNPFFYIVNGFRSSLIYKTWIWDYPWLTLYFWVFVIVMFLIGAIVFKRMKPHFADVL